MVDARTADAEAGALFRWITGVQAADLHAFVSVLTGRLVSEGVPLWRLTMTVLAMHPEIACQNAYWTPDASSLRRPSVKTSGQIA